MMSRMTATEVQPKSTVSNQLTDLSGRQSEVTNRLNEYAKRLSVFADDLIGSREEVSPAEDCPPSQGRLSVMHAGLCLLESAAAGVAAELDRLGC